jgi:hypothetical protein
MRKMKNNFNIVISRKPSLPKSSIIPAHWEWKSYRSTNHKMEQLQQSYSAV